MGDMHNDIQAQAAEIVAIAAGRGRWFVVGTVAAIVLGLIATVVLEIL